ncbi:MAG: XRE family transcriptional regulator [Myxococcaceae bacterium]|nr:MAG: XRE family transcriptional regulator [Myxococcaceae bacterium]
MPAQIGPKRKRPKEQTKQIDEQIGLRIMQRRNQLKMSQSELGECLGITFQQIQKYERGLNRVSASALVFFAKALNAPIAHFYEGIEGVPPREPTAMDKFVATRDGIEGLTALSKMKPPLRRAFIDLAGQAAK